MGTRWLVGPGWRPTSILHEDKNYTDIVKHKHDMHCVKGTVPLLYMYIEHMLAYGRQFGVEPDSESKQLIGKTCLF